MAWEVFNRKVNRVGTPAVAFMQSGRISLNKAAAKRLDDMAVDQVVLLWDPVAGKVGIRPMAKKDARAYPLNRSGKGGGAGFSGVLFFNHIGFNYKAGTKSFDAVWNDDQGMFELDVNDALAGRQMQTPLLTLGVGGRKGQR